MTDEQRHTFYKQALDLEAYATTVLSALQEQTEKLQQIRQYAKDMAYGLRAVVG